MFENIDKKKTLLLAAVVVAVGVLVWFLYMLWRPTPPEELPGGVNVNEPGGLPPVGGGNVNIGGGLSLPPGGEPGTGELPPGGEPAPGSAVTQALTDNAVQAPEVVGDMVRYYDPATCQFYEVAASGAPQALGEARYCQVKQVTWSPDGGQSIMEFPDGANVVYDFRTGKQYTLPREMTEFSFSPDGQKVAGKYLGDTSADNWIVTVNPNGSALKGIAPMGDNADKVQVEWAPNNQVIAISRTGEAAGLFEQRVLLIGFNNENFRDLAVEGRGFDSRWSPDGSRLLYSVYSDSNDYRPSLWLVDGSTDQVGANKQALYLNTWVDKCTLQGNSAYCAVPQQLPAGVSFARELARGTPDTIWRVDLATGGTSIVGEPVANNQGIGAINLTVSADGRTLFFTDEVTGQLRSMPIRP